MPPNVIGRLVTTGPNEIYQLTEADLSTMQVQITDGAALRMKSNNQPATYQPPVYIPPTPVASLPQYGSWSSSIYFRVGDVQLVNSRVDPNGSAIGQVVFRGSPCGTATMFLGTITTNSASLTMTIGRCGLTTVNLERATNGVWYGTYTSQFPDFGTIQMQ